MEGRLRKRRLPIYTPLGGWPVLICRVHELGVSLAFSWMRHPCGGYLQLGPLASLALSDSGQLADTIGWP